MAVTSTAIDSVITGLVTTLRATTGFKDPSTSGTSTPVYDGAIVSDQDIRSAVVIGGDGDPDSTQRPGRWATEWEDLDLTILETGVIQAAVVVWSGDTAPATFGTQRASAIDIYSDVDVALRASITAAQLGVTQLLWLKIDSGELIQAPFSDGTITRLPFLFGYKALLQVT